MSTRDWLPEGWTCEEVTHSEKAYLIIHHPEGGFVTVDYDARVFRGGMAFFGATNGPKQKLKRRNWSRELEDAAVEWLRGVEDGRS